MPINSVLFDLDGTLLDSAHLIENILNSMRASRGQSVLLLSSYRKWISLGAADLVGNAMEATEHDIPSLVKEFRSRYFELPTPINTLFPGVVSTLNSLVASGVQLAICSNKPEYLCRKVLIDTGLNGHFASVVGGDTVSKAKPHREPLDYALAVLGVNSNTAIFVGDSTVDQRAAIAAQLPFVFFKGGYDDGVDIVAANWCIDSVAQVCNIVGAN